MENQKIEVKLSGDQKELIIRHGEAEPIKHPYGVVFSGVIGSIKEYLSVNIPNPKQDIITYSYNHQHIVYKKDYKCPNKSGDIVFDYVKVNDHFLKDVMQINTGKKFQPMELANTLKMNRRFFENREHLDILVAKLVNFKANVSKQIEKSDNRNNAKRDIIVQEVAHEIPSSIVMDCPVIIGSRGNRFNIELYFDFTDTSVNIEVVSPELVEITEKMTEEIINAAVEDLKSYGVPIIHTV